MVRKFALRRMHRSVGWTILTAAIMCVLVCGSPAAGAVRKSVSVPKIFDADDRHLVTDTTAFPASAIGQVQATIGDRSFIGTGAMIGEKTVLTCGHVVYDPELGAADSVYFVPGKNGTKQPFGRIKAAKVITLDPWTKFGDDNYDLALLILESSVGKQTGYFQIQVQPPSFFSGNRLVYSAGYPQDLGFGEYQYSVTGNVYALDGNLFLHSIDTEPGQSGSPVWSGDAAAGTARVFGVDTGWIETISGSERTADGMGMHITQEFANWITANQPTADDPNDTPSTPIVLGTGGCGNPLGGFVVLAVFCSGAALTTSKDSGFGFQAVDFALKNRRG